MPQSPVIILGAGLSGLSFARELLRRTKSEAIILEKEPLVGGLARTVVREGFRFDLGGHRFFSDQPEIMDWLRELLGPELLEVQRRSRIRLGGRYVDYPLVLPQAMAAFGPRQAVGIALSYLWSACRRPLRRAAEANFEEWVRARFGSRLYRIYFQPYTEKVWGIPCREISRDWARERITLTSLGKAVRRALFQSGPAPRTAVTSFLYPRRGIGRIAERLGELLEASGRCRILLSTTPRRLVREEGGRVRLLAERSGEALELTGRRVVSTVPVHDLLELLDPAPRFPDPATDPRGLLYRDLICVFAEVGRPRVSEDTWTYFPEPRYLFGRMHEPRNWSPEMAPDGRSSLCLEIFCSRGDGIWSLDDGELVRRTLAGAEESGMVERGAIARTWVERVSHAYPVFNLGYERRLEAFRRALAAEWPEVLPLGRTGSFRYLNMDHVVAAASEAAGEEARRGAS